MKIHNSLLLSLGTDNTGNTSPCQGGNGARPMKLKIYVCTEAETRNGQCEPCRTEACFYKSKIDFHDLKYNKQRVSLQ